MTVQARHLPALLLGLLLAACGSDSPPSVTKTVPEDGAVGVDPDTPISMTFREELEAELLEGGEFKVTGPDKVRVEGTLRHEGARLTFIPAQPLTNHTGYTAVLQLVDKDPDTFPPAFAFAWQFRTGGPPPPTVAARQPAPGTRGVRLDTRISVMLSDELEPATVTSNSFFLSEGTTGFGEKVPGTVAIDGAIVTFIPSSPLGADRDYTVTLGATIRSIGNAQLGTTHHWSFRTGREYFTVVSVLPAPDSPRVRPSARISAVFDVPVEPASITSQSFTLVRADGTPVEATLAVAGETAVLIPTAPLAYGATYTATLATSIRSDTEGAALRTPRSWTFTTTQVPQPDTVEGWVTYDQVLPEQDSMSGSVRLAYARQQPRPARRVQVEALDSTGNPVARATTDDQGHYLLSVPDGTSVTVRALARTQTTGAARDGILPDACEGASWDVRVVDNTRGKALYVLDAPAPVTSPDSASDLHAALHYSQGAYTARQAAPFALVDSITEAIERACEGNPALALPRLDVNWSPNNTPSQTYAPEFGAIVTSHYVREQDVSQLYILGRQNVDTDEYDRHIIAHEFGHFLEDRVYRSDSIGGRHALGDILDPRLAFGEGFGNALSGMVFRDPLYIDTSDFGQMRGFSVRVSTSPTGNDRGLYSERSVQYFLWSLFEATDAVPSSGSFQRIHGILADHHPETPAFTTLQSFAAFYNVRHGGDAEGLRSLWSVALDSPYDALCLGFCTGTGDAADPFDTDNELGRHYSVSRSYFGRRDAEFWRLYRTLEEEGFPAPGTGHERLMGYNGGLYNWLGAQRWYLYTGTGSPKRFSITQPGGLSCPARDVINVLVYDRGAVEAFESLDGCEPFSIPGELGRTYVIVVYGVDLTGWGITPN